MIQLQLPNILRLKSINNVQIPCGSSNDWMEQKIEVWWAMWLPVQQLLKLPLSIFEFIGSERNSLSHRYKIHHDKRKVGLKTEDHVFSRPKVRSFVT